jgi:hypothetical protein
MCAAGMADQSPATTGGSLSIGAAIGNIAVATDS